MTGNASEHESPANQPAQPAQAPQDPQGRQGTQPAGGHCMGSHTPTMPQPQSGPVLLWRMIALAALVPCLMMAGVFFAVVFDFGFASVPGILQQPEAFAHEYAFIIWFAGLWSCFALLNAVGLGIILVVNFLKSRTKGTQPPSP